MLTLILLAVWFMIGTTGTLMLHSEHYEKQANFLFFNMTLYPIVVILFLILIIGLAPVSLQ